MILRNIKQYSWQLPPAEQIQQIAAKLHVTAEIVQMDAQATCHDIAVTVARYNVEHASPANRAWAARRLQEELHYQSNYAVRGIANTQKEF